MGKRDQFAASRHNRGGLNDGPADAGPSEQHGRSQPSSPGHAMEPGAYAPSPNTCSQALARANQLRVQALLRQLLTNSSPSDNDSINQRIDALRVLRKTLRQIDYELSWLAQVDLLEAVEQILRSENESHHDWRLINDCTQLLIEALPKLPYEPDIHSLSQIFSTVIQNLGHPRSEPMLQLFIDYGLANQRNPQAQRGAILSLPLLMTEQVVEGEDLLSLIRCLSELLVDANAQLFYSLYLALQRLHKTIGDRRFAHYLSQCDTEAMLLYKQAASRNNSLATPDSIPRGRGSGQPSATDEPEMAGGVASDTEAGGNKQVTFQGDKQPQLALRRQVSQHQQVTGERKQTRPSDTSSAVSSSSSGDTEEDEFRARGHDVRADDDGGAGGKQEPQPGDAPATGGSPPGESERNGRGSGASSAGSGVAQALGRPQVARAATLSSVSSTCSSQANLVDPSHYMSPGALSGKPMLNYELIHKRQAAGEHSATGLAINDLSTCCTPTMELGPGADTELRYGIFPRHLVAAALHSRHLDRLEALQELMCIIRDSPINHLAILMTYFDSFLEQFLARLMEPGSDFKVELIAIDMIETIVIKTKLSTMHYARPMVGLLMRALADSRAIFRENTCRVLHKMMAYLPPQHVIDAIFEHKHHKAALVREEAVNRVTAAVLEYDRNEFNLTKLCYHILPMLADHHANVRLASLECLATLAHALGQERIGSLLTAAEAVQTGCDYDGLLDAIHARLRRRQLPRCNPTDGSVRYVIKPFLSMAHANYHQEHQAADVHWVLEAPSSHQHVGMPAASALATAVASAPGGQQAEQHHGHRPGAYSPPSADRRRRSVAVVSQLVHNELHSDDNQDEDRLAHVHHHRGSMFVGQAEASHLGLAQQIRPEPREASEAPPLEQAGSGSVGRRSDPIAGPSGGARSPPVAPPGGHRRRMSLGSNKTQPGSTGEQRAQRQANAQHTSENSSRKEANDGVGHASESPATAQVETRASRRPSGQQAASRRPREKQSGFSGARSSSQDSISSNDTNKVLFQYYLSKFKQSLTEANSGIMHSVLPSDSIIYTDTAQAYALTRHQSRHQQTSFDYDSDSVGRVPTSVVPLKAKQAADQQQWSQQHQRQHAEQPSEPRRRNTQSKGRSQRANSKQVAAASSSSGSESPLTVMEAPAHHSAGFKRRQTLASSEPEAERQEAARQSSRRSSRHLSLGDNEISPLDFEETRVQGAVHETKQHERKKSIGSVKLDERRRSSTAGGQPDAEDGAKFESRRDEPAEIGGHQTASSTGDERMSRGPRSSGRSLVRQSASHGEPTPQQQEEEPEQEPLESQPPEADSARSSADSQSRHQKRPSTRRRPSRQEAAAAAAATTTEDTEVRATASNEPATTDESGANNLRRQDSQQTTASESMGSTSRRQIEEGSSKVEREEEALDDERHRDSRRRRSRRKSQSRRRSGSRETSEAHQTDTDTDRWRSDAGHHRQGQASDEVEVRRRASRSQPPVARPHRGQQQQHQHHAHQEQHAHFSRTPSRSQLHQYQENVNNYAWSPHQLTAGGSKHHVEETSGRRAVSVSPSLAGTVNIRHILENVAEVEGPFQEPQLAFRVALDALDGPCWSTKVEGLLALIRLATYHQQLIVGHLHEVMSRTANETRNLRSTVARSAIFALGDFSTKLKRSIEPELENIVQALLQKSIENTAFIRDDIRRAFSSMIEHLTQWRLANALIHHGANHRNMHVRRMASQFIALLVEKMGAAKCLVGARDISAQLIPAAAKFSQDSSPHTRYYGRVILAKIMTHGAFERLSRKNLTPNLFRSTLGVIESVKRRGPGEPPAES